MSRKSSLIVLSVTVVLTLFIAVTAYFLNPDRGSAAFSEEVKSEAENRQTQSLVSVDEPLETDLETRENEDRIASRVASKLSEDDDFLTTVGESSAEYVDSKMGAIEEKYAQSTDEKIALSAESVRKDIKSTDEIASALLENEAFMSALENAMKDKYGCDCDAEKIAEAVVQSDAFKKALAELIEAEKSDTVPLPVFSYDGEPAVSEEEYREARSAERSDEISRVLEFLGY